MGVQIQCLLPFGWNDENQAVLQETLLGSQAFIVDRGSEWSRHPPSLSA